MNLLNYEDISLDDLVRAGVNSGYNFLRNGKHRCIALSFLVLTGKLEFQPVPYRYTWNLEFSRLEKDVKYGFK